MYKNDFVTSIISINIRNVLNDSIGSRTELVQNANDTSKVCNVPPCRLPSMAQAAQSCTEACMHKIKDAIRL